MKLEIKLMFILVAVFIIANPLMINAKGLNPGDANYKDPLIALILSLVIPGLGHMYLGQTNMGLIYLAIYVGVWALAGALLWTTLDSVWYIIPLVMFAFAIWVALDAMKLAKRYNAQGGRLSMVDTYSPSVLTVN